MKSGLVLAVVIIIIIVGGILLWQAGVFSSKASEPGDTVSVPVSTQNPVTFTPPAPITTTTPSTLPTLPETTSSYAGEETYTVKKGDTLWKISKHFYGTGEKYKLIQEANKDKTLDPLKIGIVLVIPKNESFKSPSMSTPEPKVRYHTVKKNDTLKKLAQRYYKDSTKSDLIFEANRDKLATPETSLKPGWRLVIPSESEPTPKTETPIIPSGSPE
jgi:nucleoid-associated protein YgaU